MTITVKPPNAKSRSMPLWARIIGWATFLGILIAISLCIALVVSVGRVAAQMPSFNALKAMQTGRTIRIHAADGTVIQNIGPAYGEWVSITHIPDSMKEAIIAIEDRRFENHFGIDIKSVLRASWLAYRLRGTDRRLQGASTITQQAARTLFLNNRYDMQRKLREMVIALAMEQRLSKDQILELYLNRVYLGGGAYGFDAASRRFFGHPGTNLTIPEAALLAGLAKAPSNFAPSADEHAAFSRARVVLEAMSATGAVARSSSSTIAMPALVLQHDSVRSGVGYFLDWIRPQIDMIVGDAQGTIDVWTTVDTTLQAAAEKAAANNAPKGAQIALTSIDREGRVRAMVGGLDYTASSYNRAIQATRQPGSSFKLFVYLAALEAGRRPSDVVQDRPIMIDGWAPRNSNDAVYGAMPLTDAFAKSVNTIAVQMAREAGYDNVAKVARRLGVTSPINTDPAIALGASGVHLIDMVRAYASVGAGGASITPYGIEKISVSGREIYHYTPDPRQILAPAVARDMTSMLKAVVSEGTGRAASIGRAVAGKTGTTNSSKDGWFVGFTSGVTTGVWIGRDDSKPVPGLQGGHAPARTFAAYMAAATKGQPLPAPEVRISIPGWSAQAEGKGASEAAPVRSASRGEVNRVDSDTQVTVHRDTGGDYIEETYRKSRAIPTTLTSDPTS